jgi:hypothetical protein
MSTSAGVADSGQNRVQRPFATIGHRSRDDFRVRTCAGQPSSERRANIGCGQRALEGVRRDNDAWHVAEIGIGALEALECSAASRLPMQFVDRFATLWR